MDAILDVDLLAFEEGTAAERSAVVDGTMRSLETGFVYTAHDVSSGLIDQAYEMLATFFALDGETKRSWTAEGTHGQTGYTGLLVETAATSDEPDWKEMLNWGERIPTGHPLRTQFPNRYHEPVLPEADVPGITETLLKFHSSIADIQRRFLRIIAVGVGADETLFDETVAVGANLTRAIRYPPMEQAPGGSHVWAGAHADINLITALPRATARGLQVEIDGTWFDAIPPDGHVIINTGLMLERLTNGRVPSGHASCCCRPRTTRSTTVRGAVLPSGTMDHADPDSYVCHPRTPAQVSTHPSRRRSRRSAVANQFSRRWPTSRGLTGFLRRAPSSAPHARTPNSAPLATGSGGQPVVPQLRPLIRQRQQAAR